MVSAPGFELDTKRIAALPIVNHFLCRIRVDELLESYLPAPDPRSKLTPAKALGVLLRNLILARVPLYGLQEWAAERVPSLLGLSAEQVRWLNDDRVGRALDRLFDVDRSALLTELVVHVVKEFDVSLDQLHNDSTSLMLHGEYDGATGKLVRGKPTLLITHGHSKDVHTNYLFSSTNEKARQLRCVRNYTPRRPSRHALSSTSTPASWMR